MAGPLSGLRVLDLTTIISGPVAAAALADQGADVIKIEAPGTGDLGRMMGARRNGMGSAFTVMHRSKRSLALDVRTDGGRDLLLRLARTADVFIQNFRPGVVERLGIGYDDVAGVNPGIIYASISGFGPDGPYAARRVYDPVIQATCGYTALQADPDTGEPQMVRMYICDKVTGLTAAQAILSALFARSRGAGGQHVRISMLEAGLSFIWLDGMWNQTFVGQDIEPGPEIGEVYRVIRTKDGFITMIAVSQDEWEGLCRALRLDHLIADPRFSDREARRTSFEEFRALMTEAFLGFETDEVCRRLEAEDVPFSRIHALSEVAADPQIVHSGSVLALSHPVAGPMRHPRPPARFGGTPTEAPRPAPALGQHTDEILEEIGVGPDEIAMLRREGVL